MTIELLGDEKNRSDKKVRPGNARLYQDTEKAVFFRDIPGVVRIVGR